MKPIHIPKIEALPDILFPNAVAQKLGQLSLFELEQNALEAIIPVNIELGTD